MLDISKTFDTVDNGFLVKKCRENELRVSTEKIISTCLKN